MINKKIVAFNEDTNQTKSFSQKQLKRMNWKKKVKWGIPVCACALLNSIEFLAREMVGKITILHSENCSTKWIGTCERGLKGNEKSVNWTENKRFGYQSVGAILEWVRVKEENEQ